MSSCSNNEELNDNSENKTSSSNFQLKNVALGIDEFKVDKRLHKMDRLLTILKPLSFDKDTEEYTNHYSDLHSVAYDMVSDYGYTEINNYTAVLVTTLADGDCCELDEDGTTNWNCCSFWETVKVLFKAIGCQQPSSLDREEAKSQAHEYYLCVQDVICENC